MGFLRTLIVLGLLVAFVYFGTTVRLGSRTLFGHVKSIWATEETQELVDGVKETSGPAVERLKRGAKAGWEAATAEPDAGAP